MNIFCFLHLHSWYYGDFQTGKISKWTGDHVGVIGRSCLECKKKQIYVKGKYIDVENFAWVNVESYRS